MQFTNRPNRPIEKDGQEYRISRSVAISVMLFFYHTWEQLRYLPLAKRGVSVEDEPGKFCLPCGYLDRDETAAEAMRREVWEEIWLNLNDLMRRYPWNGNMQQPFHVKSDPRENRQNVVLEYFMSFEVDQLPEIGPKDESSDEIAQAVRMPVAKACQIDMAFCHEMIVRERWEWTQRHWKNGYPAW